MQPQYQISIALNNATLAALCKEGYQLQVFKGIKGDNEKALPTVWYTLSQFCSHVNLKWTRQYGVYIDNQRTGIGVVVDTSNQQPVNLKDLIVLNSDGSTSRSTGKKGTIMINSKQTTEWLCGLTQAINGDQPAAICAFPLHGSGGTVILEPYEALTLVFSTVHLNTGFVINETLSSSITVRLSEEVPCIALSFDIDLGWATIPDGIPNATIYTNTINLATSLIIPIETIRTKFPLWPWSQ